MTFVIVAARGALRPARAAVPGQIRNPLKSQEG